NERENTTRTKKARELGDHRLDGNEQVERVVREHRVDGAIGDRQVLRRGAREQEARVVDSLPRELELGRARVDTDDCREIGARVEQPFEERTVAASELDDATS